MELLVKIGVDQAKLQASLGRMGAAFSGAIGGRLGGLIGAAAIEQTIRKTAEYAGKLVDLSTQTGVSIEALQRFDRAAKENGTSLESMIGLWDKLNTARAAALKDKGGTAAKAFGALGVSEKQLQSGSAEEITKTIAVAFQNSTNVESLVAPLRAVGGRGATEMVALFRAGLDQIYQDISVMTAAQAHELDELDDKFATLGQTISIGVAPALVGLIDLFTGLQNIWTKLFAGFVGMGDMVRNGKVGSIKDIGSGFASGWNVASEDIANEQAAQAKRIADKIKNNMNAKVLDFEAFDVEDKKPLKDKKEKEARAASASRLFEPGEMAKAGLFTGSSLLLNPTLIVERDQLDVLRKIEANTHRGVFT
jgi:hypothetical protein